MLRKRDEQLAKVLQAFADSTRRTILEELSLRDDQSLFEIMARLVEKHQLSITRQAISKHLKILEDAELIETAWSGRTKLHTSCIANHTAMLTRWLEDVTPKENRSQR
jgi:DNA-binding transcriptional ArsR family regulator